MSFWVWRPLLQGYFKICFSINEPPNQINNKPMIPKEKAKELVTDFCCVELTMDKSIPFKVAKKCALIAVGEILQEGMLGKAPFMYNGKDLMNHKNPIQFKDYWQQVKTEIENL